MACGVGGKLGVSLGCRFSSDRKIRRPKRSNNKYVVTQQKMSCITVTPFGLFAVEGFCIP